MSEQRDVDPNTGPGTERGVTMKITHLWNSQIALWTRLTRIFFFKQ